MTPFLVDFFQEGFKSGWVEGHHSFVPAHHLGHVCSLLFS
jgi:hypothetical protein